MTTTTLICILVVAAIVIVWFLLADEIEQERKQRRYHVFHCHRCGIPIGALQRGICDDCFPKWMEEAKR